MTSIDSLLLIQNLIQRNKSGDKLDHYRIIKDDLICFDYILDKFDKIIDSKTLQVDIYFNKKVVCSYNMNREPETNDELLARFMAQMLEQHRYFNPLRKENNNGKR